jgi:methionyl-tRNA formyltransferase
VRIYICGQKAFGRAVLEQCLKDGHDIVGVSAPLTGSGGVAVDKLRAMADDARIPVMPPGVLNSDTLPDGVDVLVAAHSHDFIGRRTRLRCKIGAIGYHPSLLPLHRGRDAIRWAVKMGDAVTGGSVYWLSDNVDAGDLAAQDWCLISPDDTPEALWREKLFPMGVRLLSQVLGSISAGIIVTVPQDEDAATWEPSFERPPLRRPDLFLLGQGSFSGFKVLRDAGSLHP